MCFSFLKKKPADDYHVWQQPVPIEPPEQKPDWMTQSREQVALEEEEAASIHYTYMELIADGSYPNDTAAGDYAHHEYWWTKHQEAAWYIRNPKGE